MPFWLTLPCKEKTIYIYLGNSYCYNGGLKFLEDRKRGESENLFCGKEIWFLWEKMSFLEQFFHFTKMQKSYIFLKEPNGVIFESIERYYMLFFINFIFPFWTLEFELNLALILYFFLSIYFWFMKFSLWIFLECEVWRHGKRVNQITSESKALT